MNSLLTKLGVKYGSSLAVVWPFGYSVVVDDKEIMDLFLVASFEAAILVMFLVIEDLFFKITRDNMVYK